MCLTQIFMLPLRNFFHLDFSSMNTMISKINTYASSQAMKTRRLLQKI